jgi:hypothetical protein
VESEPRKCVQSAAREFTRIAVTPAAQRNRCMGILG